MDFLQTLRSEFARRRQRSSQYSLRAFARDLGTDHATLSQILRERRSLSPRMVMLLGRRLGLSSVTLIDASVRQNGEAILRLLRSGSFVPNSRWISTRTGIPLDGVNAALDRLVRHRQLVMESTVRWTATV